LDGIRDAAIAKKEWPTVDENRTTSQPSDVYFCLCDCNTEAKTVARFYPTNVLNIHFDYGALFIASVVGAGCNAAPAEHHSMLYVANLPPVAPPPRPENCSRAPTHGGIAYDIVHRSVRSWRQLAMEFGHLLAVDGK
jgi:hypothetical protein